MNPTALRHQLLRGGYCPLPLRGKAPIQKNWQQRIEPTRKDIDDWAQHFSDATNTGLLTRLMPTLDIDITHPAAVVAIESLVQEKFERRGYVLSRMGKRPKTAIPFRTNEPFKKLSRSMIAPDGSTGQKIELLCDGQQIVVDGIHPETQRPYRWYGGAPGEIKYDELPNLHSDEAQALVDDVVELLCRDFGYKRPPERSRKASGGDDLSGAADWGHLADNIRSGRELHDSLRDLAAKLVTSGMSVGAAINFLHGLMEKSDIAHDARWKERYDDIPRAVETAASKQDQDKPAPAVEPRRLAEVHEIFQRWLGVDYDFDTLDATLAVAASERFSGDPVWLMVVSGSGNAKTETVQATSGLGAHVVSTISSDGALLSATPQKQRSQSATGGLLRKIGDHGILVIKDFTSILSADRNLRGTVLAALREIHDGRWVRNVGSDGGRTLQWEGRLIVIAACTTAWDQAHGVIAIMGDRFVLIRSDSHKGRIASGLRAMRNTGREMQMRKEMADAVAGLVANIDNTNAYALREEDENILVKAANLVTLARTGVELDYRGDVINAHAPEMPTRFVKQLTQIMRGGVAIGMSRLQARRLAIRCARDSMPPLRLEVLRDIAENPGSRLADVRGRLQKPRTTVDRTLQALHMLGLLTWEEEEIEREDGETARVWEYSLADGVDLAVLNDENAAAVRTRRR